jgi:signal transduction histidine kinase
MEANPLQILVVEDNQGDVRLLREMLSCERPGEFELTHVSRLDEAEAHLAKGGVDIILLDMGLPDGRGMDTVRRTHAAASGVPIIVLTGLDDEAIATEAMTQGAQDYMIKGQIESRALPRALRHAIERFRMREESDRMRSRQMQLKDEFFSHVSHELRSPLTVIRQFATILADRLAGDLNPEQGQYLEVILRNVKQLQSMVDDLFEVTGIGAGKLRIDLERASVSEAVAYTANSLQGAAKAKGITLSSDVRGELPAVYADPMRLRQALVILVDNAIKFTPANGTVKIHARVLDEDADRLVLEVSDSGCGISPEMCERIFERLFQAQDPSAAGRKGLGLGLYICKELVTRQGGQIRVQSACGQGAVFSVTLPVFSLSNLLAPAFGKKGHIQSPFTLVVTEISSAGCWRSDEARAEQRRTFGQLLQGCLYSDSDVLLPKMGITGPEELFFIAATTDQIGGEAICKRIRENLREPIQQARLSLSTSYRVLATINRATSEPVKEFREKMTAEIQARMNQENSLRMVTSG